MSRIGTATELQCILEDYKIHLTGDQPSSEQSEAPTAVTNPPDWPKDHRRVPNYRPVDKNRDVDGRPNGENAFEKVFLTIMFTGVVVNATVAKVWAVTGGPFFPGLFRIKTLLYTHDEESESKE